MDARNGHAGQQGPSGATTARPDGRRLRSKVRGLRDRATTAASMLLSVTLALNAVASPALAADGGGGLFGDGISSTPDLVGDYGDLFGGSSGGGDAADGQGTEGQDGPSLEVEEPAEWRITLDGNGSDNGAPDEVVEATEDGDSVSLPGDAFARDGFHLIGWATTRGNEDVLATESDGEERVAFRNEFVPADVRLFNLSYKYVDIDADEAESLAGAVRMGDGWALPVSDAVAAGSADDAGRLVREVDLSYALTGRSLTLYAVWEADSYAIEFDANGGVGEMDGLEASVGEELALPRCDFVRDGHGFVGWNLASDGSADEYGDEATVRDLSTEDGSTVTLYAQWREADADEERDDNGAGDDAEAGSGNGIAAKSDPAAARPSPDADEDGKDDDKSDGGSDEGSDEATPKTANILLDDEGNVAEATVSGLVKGNRAAALDALSGVRGVSGEAKGQAADLLSLRSGDQNVVDGYPRSADGSNIESINISWMSDDGRTPLEDTELVRTPTNDHPTLFQAVVDYALSGEHDYNPGDITITIPAYIFTTRDNRPAGVFDQDSTSLLADPSTATEFNWTRIDDTIVFTNTRCMDAGQTGVITFSYSGIVPHTMVDQVTSTNLDATIRVVTHRGNTMALRSDAITGRIDTFERLLNVSKSGACSIVPASEVPAGIRQSGEDHYVQVRWSTTAAYTGNQPYTLVATDTIPDEYSGVLDGHDVGTPRTVTESIYDGYSPLTSSASRGFVSYYPMSQFQPNTNYTLSNTVKYTLTEKDPAVGDDPRQVTESTASAQVHFKWDEPVFVDPPGHFMLNKDGNDGTAGGYLTRTLSSIKPRIDTEVHNTDGWYGLYPTALNRLKSGQDIEVGYTTESIGFMLPWTYEDDPRILSNYGKRAVTMVTYDTDEMSVSNMFAGLPDGSYNYQNAAGTSLLRGRDYDLVAVEFPKAPVIYKAKAINLNPDGTFSSMFVGDGSVDYAYDNDVSHIPPVRLSAKVNGAWVDLATVSWSSGSLVITPEQGVSASGQRVMLPAGCEQWRTTVEATNAGLHYYVRTIVNLKADGALGDIAEALCDGDAAVPREYVCNTTRMDVFDADGTKLVDFHKYAYDEIRGYTTKIGVKPTKTASWSVDLPNRQIRIRYQATAEEQSVITDGHTYEEAVADGELIPETSGIWYDLLPKGVVPDLNTIRLRGRDRVDDVRTVSNWRGTGRTMLIVEMILSPQITSYFSKTDQVNYCEDVPQITFEATYDIDDYMTFGADLHNVIAFESTAKDELGTIENRCGEPDTPMGGRNMYSETACVDSTERLAMTGLDQSRTGNRFVYAGVSLRVASQFDASTSLHKDIQVNADGRWSQGTYDDKRTVYEGGQYAYRLRMMSSSHTTSKNLVLYDSLENYYAVDGNDPADINAPRWRGTLVNVDMDGLRVMGCEPVLYYSCVDNLLLSDESNPRVAHPTNMNLADSSIWVRADQYTGSLANVHAIAIDASKRPDGSDFELPELQQVLVIVNMHAPEGQPAREAIAADAHAYNNIYLMSTSVDTAHGNIEHTNNFIRHDYTKVGLVEYNVTVKKAWEDDNDRDGIRPASITVQLLSDGTPLGNPVTLDEACQWQHTFEHLPYTDGTGRKIRYTTREVAVAGYDSQCLATDSQANIVNTHEPERINLAGEKTWVGDTTDVRPESITVELLANGRKVATQRVTPDDGGNWAYAFEDMFKNENGQPIEYTVREVGADSYIPSFGGDDGISITNTYHPFGDLSISKSTQNVTEDFANRGYDVMVSLYDEDGNELEGEFDYETTLNLTGTVRSGGVISLHGGETATISEIPENTTYHIEEAVPDGFSASYTGNEGTVLPNRTQACSIRNTYSASGFVNLRVRKTLEGRAMSRYAFRFQLFDENGNPIRGAYNEADGSIVFGALDYTEADAGHTYTYTIIETDRGRPGYTYDHGETYVDVAVEDNGDGTLTVTPTYRTVSASGDGMNILRGTALGGGLVATTGEATWAAAGWTATGATGTEVADADDAPSETIAKMVNLPSGTASVIQRDVPLASGETYTLSGYARLASSGTATGAFGIYDEQSQTWAGRATPAIGDDEWEAFSTTITVPDGDDKPWRVVFGKNGTAAVDLCGLRLEAGEEATPYDAYESAGPAAFANAYRAEGSITLRAWKQLQGGRGVESGEFTFELCDENGNVVGTATNDASGKIVFPEIEYDQYDAGHTYHYIARERRGSDETITYDDSSFGYSVEVVDNGDGTLTCSTGYVSVNPITERLAFADIDPSDCSLYPWVSVNPSGPQLQGAYFALVVPNADTSAYTSITQPANWASMSSAEQTAAVIELFAPLLCAEMETDLGVSLAEEDFTYLQPIPSGSGFWRFAIKLTEAGFDKIEESVGDIGASSYSPDAGIVVMLTPQDASVGDIHAFLSGLESDGSDFVTGTPVVTGYDIDASEEGEIPVFVNEEKPGSLSITKTVAYGTPQQKSHEDFTFLVKLNGPDLPETIDYELTEAEAPTLIEAVAIEANTSDEIEGEFTGPGEYWEDDGNVTVKLMSYPSGYCPTGRIHDLYNNTWIECDDWYAPSVTVNTASTGIHRYEFELESGATGQLGGLTWRVKDGVLEIFPTNGVQGAYYGSSSITSPWYSYRDQITSVIAYPGSKMGGVISSMFANLSSATSIDLTELDISSATSLASLFYGDAALTDISFNDTGIGQNVSATSMFNGCTSLKELDLSSWRNTPSETYNILTGCQLESLDVSGLTITSSLAQALFNNIKYLTAQNCVFSGSSINPFPTTLITADLSGSHLSSLSTAAFKNKTTLLQSISLADCVLPTNLKELFRGCTSLRSVDLTNAGQQQQITSVEQMFYGCSSLQNVTGIGHLAPASTHYTREMFYGCSELAALDLSQMNLANKSYSYVRDMFSGCAELSSVTLGENFAFPASGSNRLTLPSGNWTNGDVTLTETELAQQWNSSMAGTWEKVADAGGSGIASHVVLNLIQLVQEQLAPTPAYAVTDGWTQYDACEWRITDGALTVRPLDNAAEANMTFPVDSSGTALPWNQSGMTYTSATFESTIHVSGNLEYLFYAKNDLRDVDLRGLDTGGVTYMYSLFTNCPNLGHIDMRGLVFNYANTIFNNAHADTLDISNAQLISTWGFLGYYVPAVDNLVGTNVKLIGDHHGTFRYGCGNVDLQDMDLSECTSIYGLFEYCGKLKHVTLSSRGSCAVTDMSDMFYSCSQLETVDFSGLDTSNATTMHALFQNCPSLVSVDMSGCDTSSVTDMALMFYICPKLESIAGVSDFDTSNVTSMYQIFYQCGKLSELILPWNTPNLQTADNAFSGTPLDTLDLSGWDFSNVSFSRLGIGCTVSGGGGVRNLILDNCILPTTMAKAFQSSVGFVNVSMRNCDGALCTDMSEMFYGSPGGALQTVDFSGSDFSHVLTMRGLLQNCTRLESVNFAGVTTNDLQDMSYMFYSCINLQELDLRSFDTRNVSRMDDMCYGCTALTDVNVSTFDTRRVTSFYVMFCGCTALEELDLSSFVVSSSASDSGMLSSAGLKKLILGPATVISYAALRTPPTTAPYDGTWLRVDDGTAMSAYQACTEANGTYVWNTSPKYFVAYDPNGGVGKVERINRMPDEQFEIEECAFTLYDHDFNGWNTAPDGTGTAYETGQVVSNIGADDEVVTLYAQWASRSHTVALDDGTFMVTVPAGSTLTIPNLPAGTSYQVFEQSKGGWVPVSAAHTTGSIEPLETAGARFQNAWDPTKVSTQFIAHKTMDGESAPDGSFSFELLENGRVIQTKQNSTGGAIVFDPIVYNMEGEHDYEIREVVGADAETVIYDRHTAAIYVRVEDVDGLLSCTTEQYDEDLNFVNSSKPASLRIEKEIDGETTASRNDEFTFSVRLLDSGVPITNAHVTKNRGETAVGIIDHMIDALLDFAMPHRAYAVENTATVTFDAGDGSFTGGAQTNSIVLSKRKETQVVHTPNVLDDGTGTRLTSGSDEGYTTVNMDWADTVTADMWYGTYGTSYSWAAVYPLNVTPSRANYSSASISGGKLGGGVSYNAYAKPANESYHKIYNLSGKGAHFAYYINTSYTTNTYGRSAYGYHATVTGIRNQVLSGQIEAPSANNPSAYVFSHWVDGSGNTVDTSDLDLSQDLTLYARYIPIGRSGSAYAVLDSAGNLVMCRSNNTYANAVNGTLVDVWGNSRVGRIFAIDESGTTTTVPWASYRSSVKTVSVAENQTIIPVSCYQWFYSCSNLTSADLSGIDTSKTLNMATMFSGCSRLTSLDTTGWDTSHVLDMSQMFYNCGVVATPLNLDVSTWDTSNVTTMSNMFNGYRGDTVLDLSDWDTHSVTNMAYMFNGSSIRELDVSGFDMTSVTTLGSMLNSAALRKVVLGENFKFVDGSNSLPKPTDADSAERWYNSDLNTDGYTPSELAQQYDASLAGTWEWYHVEYDIAYDTNGGLGDAADDHAVYETAVTLPNAPFTRPGYDMSGWNTQPDGSGDTYANGAKVKNLTVVNGDTVTLYAQWADKHYKVVFDKNGAFLGSMGKQEMVRNTPEDLDACGFIRPGYTFDGWDTSADGTGTHYDDGEEVVNLCLDEPEITLYAQWRRYSDPTITGDAEGVYTITLKGGEHADFEGLPAGASYEVVETDLPSGWAQASASGTAGTLVADETATASFSNRYATTGEAVIETFKSLVGREIGTGEFAFELLDGEGTVLETASNDMLLSGDSEHAGQAPVTFSPLSYDQEGTWHYTIREAAGDDATVDYSETIVPVTVTMTDKGHGQLGATVTYGSGDNDDSFENRVKPGALEIRKATNRTSYASWDKSFAFDVSLSDSLGNPLSTDGLTITKVDRAGSESEEEGSVEGGRMTVSMRGGESVTIAGLPHGATYSVSEQDASGWTLAESSGTTGTIAATQTSEATFDNEYWAEGTFSVSGAKVLTGRSLVAGEFTFELVDPDGGVVASATNAADGSFEFTNLDIQEGWAGATRTYHVRERTGSVAHVTYDGHVEDVTVTFSDDGLGHLSAAVSYDASGCSFLNAYALGMPQVGGPGLAQVSAAVAMVVTCLAAMEIGRRRLMRDRDER